MKLGWFYFWSSDSILNYIKFHSLIQSYLIKLKYVIFCASLANAILKEILCSMLDDSFRACSQIRHPPPPVKISCPWDFWGEKN